MSATIKAALGHYWTTPSVIVIIIFVVLGFIFSAMKLDTRFDPHSILKVYYLGRYYWRRVIIIIAGFFLHNLKLAGAIKHLSRI
jgi:hypothetical protein